MNIYSINKKIRYFIVVLLSFFLFAGQSWGAGLEIGYPFFYNITPSENGYGSNNFSLAQDSRGVMYVGNFNGIVEYDGVEWNRIKLSGNPILKADNYGRVYCGGYNELGYLLPNDRGRTYFKKLFVDTTGQIGQLTNICHEYNKLYFTTENSVYVYEDSSAQLLYRNDEYVSLFEINHRLFIASGKGLHQINSAGEVIFTNSCHELGSEQIVSMLSGDGDYIVLTNHDIYSFRENVFYQLGTGVRNVINMYGVSHAIRLSDASYALATQKGGIYFFNNRGAILHYLDRNSGLYDDKIFKLYVDNDNNLWAALSNGLSIVEVPSAYSYYNTTLGLRGKVNSILRHNGVIYTATSNGIYTLGWDKNGERSGFRNSSFSQVPGMSEESFDLVSVGNDLLAGTIKGLYIITENERRRFIRGEINQIIQSKYNKDEYFVSNKGSVLIIKKIESEWTIVNSSPFLSSSISTIAEDSLRLWIGTLNDGIYSIAKASFFDKRSIQNFQSGKGLPASARWIDVYSTAKGVVFSTYSGLYRYDANLERFYKDDLIPVPVFERQRRVLPVIEDENQNLWLSYEVSDLFQKQISVAWNLEDVSRYTLISQPFSRISDFVCETIYPDSNFVVWFGGFDGIIRLDFKQLQQDSLDVTTLIREVTVGGDSVLVYSPEFNSSFQKGYIELPYRLNSIKFKYATPSFDNNQKVKHQYKLEGYDKEWSDFDEKNMKEYTNLAPGEYRFQVRAKNMYSFVTKNAVFQFAVSKPFYATWWAITCYVIVLLSFIVALMRWRAYRFSKEKTKLEKIITDRTEELLREKEKTERLLANILPERTVKELKDKGRATSMRFNMVTVLFSDIQGFTKIAEQMNPDKLVDELDKFFLQFDSVVERCNIEKIKTIGDAYMCAGGIPQKNKTNPIEVVTAALEMQHYIEEMKRIAHQEGNEYWGLRIGIHTGPVVAGVIGSKKFTYDIWGDTVNIASRMESSGEVGRVNISEDTYFLIKQYFNCEYRGKMPVKYKGDIDMYFVNGFKVQFAHNLLPIKPNESFVSKLRLLKYEDLEDYILDKLESELPETIYYHDIKHTIDVIVHTEIFAREEGVSNEDLLLLKTAALFHDIGFIVGYRDHEMLGIQLANEILPKFRYAEEQIKIIGDLIYATRMPHNPKNLLEQIMCDADLNYLGRSDYIPVSSSLYEELIAHDMIKESEYEWNKLQLKFLQSHRFFTDTAKRLRNANKVKQLENIALENERLQKEEESISSRL